MRWGNRGRRLGSICPGAQGTVLRLGALALGFAAVACGSGSEDNTAEASGSVGQSTTESTGLPACGEGTGQVVLFGVQGVLTDTEDGTVVEGALEIVQTYHDLGYGIVYQTLLLRDAEFDGQAWAEVLGQWLQTNGFPYEGPSQVISVQEPEQAAAALVNLLTDDQTAAAAYIFDDLFVAGLLAGGIPGEHIYTTTGDANAMGTTALPQELFPDHAAEIAAQPPICRR